MSFAAVGADAVVQRRARRGSMRLSGVGAGGGRRNVTCMAPQRGGEVERAELAVQTNNTRAALRRPTWCEIRQRPQGPGGGRCADGRPAERRRTTSRCVSSTLRWWASRLDGIPSLLASSEGDASLVLRCRRSAAAPGRPARRRFAARRSSSASFAQRSLPQY